jgi:BA14K-like protein
MKGLLVLQTVLALRETSLCCVVITLIGGVALAQTPGTVDPSPAPAEPSTKEDMPPPGACMPMGVTVSGEIVFPFQCKDFIERQKAADQKPAAAEERPATAGERPPGAQEKSTAPEEKATTRLPATEESDNGKPAAEPTETGAIPKHPKGEHRARSVTAPGCTRFRTYDPASGTYRSYDGHRRSCP